jgi:DNA mismatch repair ATPase MutS
MYRDRDLELKDPVSTYAADQIKDLGLQVLFEAMAGGDEFLLDVARKVILSDLTTPDEILYRQQVMVDCMENPDIVRELYGVVVDGILREKRIWGWMSEDYPMSTLTRAIEVLELFSGLLTKLRQIADQRSSLFHSEGFRRLFDVLVSELNDDYLQTIADHLHRLRFRGGVLMSAKLGQGNRGKALILRTPPLLRQRWIERFQDWFSQLGHKGEPSYFYEIADRDEAGGNALSELRNRGIASVAAALAQSTDHILSFFKMFRLELGFYLGCLNLHDRLTRKGEPVCIPVPLPADHPTFCGKALYDPCLSLNMADRVVGNHVAAEEKTLVIITGANRGGKSTLLRSMGLAQLMMQCGMFVAAESFSAGVCKGIFTHFKREEDTTMKSGKLDEELSRMRAIVTAIVPHSLVLLNESFASTNEREGSEIARQIVRALLEMQIKVFYVTHMFDLAYSLHQTQMDSALFLRAERLPDGQRTFRLTEGEPLPTSYGVDLYRRIFSTGQAAPEVSRTDGELVRPPNPRNNQSAQQIC